MYLQKAKSRKSCNIIIWRGGSKVEICPGKLIKSGYSKT